MQVCHMNGAGNDFMVLDARDHTYDLKAMALKFCALTGADGFMALDHSEKADFRLHFYNADGTRGEMCGNGARCICRYAYDRGLAGEHMTVETDAGIIKGQRLDETRYRVALNLPSVLDLQRKENIAYVELGNPGLPHAVMEYDGDPWKDSEKLRPLMKALRRDPAFPKGANVSFYRWTGEDRIRILTYERGVEDFTLACGTGTGSTAAVIFAEGKLPRGTLLAENRGGLLKATVCGRGTQVSSLLLEGPTEVVKVYTL